MPETGTRDAGTAAGATLNAPGPLSRQFARLRAAAPAGGPVAADPLSREMLTLAARAARSSTTILVTGPSGAGKDVLARYLHAESPRRDGPFLALNCAALPDAMLESLLFGHERGAFTGATTSASGLFRAATGGTLFLDEVGELPLALQAKLLRAIEAREVLPLGATRPVGFDARLIAATNRDLAAEAAAGRFRNDLYWRLAVFPIALAPLAQRPGDILPLVAHLLGDCAVELSEAALGALLRHDWPGNIRELANRLERARILAGDGPLTDAHLDLPEQAAAAPAPLPLPGLLRRHEADMLALALAETGGRRRDAARSLGISERTLRYKLAAQAGRPRGAAVHAARVSA